jgi:putative PEP-CTERM system TPR-repeat lipoprotein
MPRRVINRALSASVVLTTLMLAAGLSGCGKTESSASLMAEAKQYQQKGDNKAALIQLKNAATKSPEDAEVRIQLAVLYNQTGDPVSAEKEIRKAISLGADNARAAPELAKALLQQGQAQKALDASSAAAAKAGPELLAVRGNAFLSLNQPDQAREAYQQALTAKPGYAEAMLGMARLAMIGKDAAAGAALTEQAIAANPKDPAVYFFKGSLLRAQGGKSDEAIAAFGQAIALKPDHATALVERASLEIGARKFDAAKADLEAAKKLAPASMQVLYTQALLDFTQEKFAAAHESLQKLLSAAPEHMPTLLLAGATELNLGTLKQSEQHLKKYIEKAPDNAYARKLLAQAQLKSSEPLDAAATLAPLLKDGAQDAQLLALAGEAAMQARDFAKASQYFEKASALSPNTAVLHTSLGLARLGAGDREKAIAELERATTLDPKSESAGVALVRTELGLKQVDKAVASVKTLVAAQPESAAVQNLAGGVYLAKGDRAAARASFEKAATLEPTLFAAVMNLAQMDMDDKKPDAAKQRLVAFLDKDKKNSNAMAALAALELNQKRPHEATLWLEKANAENPEAIAPATQLANHYLRTNQAPKALILIRKLQTANPANPELLDLLGQIQLANNDQAGALETYSKLVNVVPKSAAAQFRLASVHMKMKNAPEAAEDLKKALAIDPNFMQAKLGQVDLAMAKGNSDQALVLVRQIQKAQDKSPVGYLLEGDILSSQKKPALAIRPYEQAFAIAKTPQLLVKLAQAMKAAGQGKQADLKLAQWQKEHPADTFVAGYIAQGSLAAKQYKQAIEQFEAISKREPANAGALNNLAWAYQQEKDARALPTAERAFQLAGDNPAVLDTLGWILVEQGNTTRGIPLLQKAVSAAPTSSDIRYHLALGLNKSGDKVNARKELEKSLADGKNFLQADEARALLKQM